MILSIEHVMPAERVTDKDGRWFLVQAITVNDTFITVVSERAPIGTAARDLKPHHVEIIPGQEWDMSEPIEITVEDLNNLMRWPR
jgi:hypothetical protein